MVTNPLDLIVSLSTLDAEPEVLDALSAAAAQRAENIRLEREREFLRRRIAEEDARLAHA
jgi:hypothetical protein